MYNTEIIIIGLLIAIIAIQIGTHVRGLSRESLDDLANALGVILTELDRMGGTFDNLKDMAPNFTIEQNPMAQMIQSAIAKWLGLDEQPLRGVDELPRDVEGRFSGEREEESTP
jgi:hypothetical protein